MSLKEDVASLLDHSILLCKECPDSTLLEEKLKELRKRLDIPLRVAVVGIMKAGKSTFMNALLGADVVITGDVETTYTVCWFRYGKTPGLQIYFRDGTKQSAPFEDLKKWSVRAYEKENSRINDVKYLIIQYPAPILKSMEFIDTPGLNSVYQKDAQNTLDFLAIQGAKETVAEAGMADAVIYAFSRTAGDFDQKILKAFHGNGELQASPINSLGILTKADGTGIWQVYDEVTPVQKANAVAKKIMQNQEMTRLLFTVLPVSAKSCAGVSQLDQRDWSALQRLSHMDIEDLKDYISDSREFKTCEDSDFSHLGTVEVRSSLMDKLGQYGILQTVVLLQKKVPPQNIAAMMSRICGVDSVRNLVLSHFGSRTSLIKAQYIFSHLNSFLYEFRGGDLTPRLRQLCFDIQEKIQKLQDSIQSFRELHCLQMYYSGQLVFSTEEEKRDFLRITGEYGSAPEIRLGTKPQNSVSELADTALQKANLWHSRETFGWMISSEYVQTCGTLARSCEQIYYHLHALLDS